VNDRHVAPISFQFVGYDAGERSTNVLTHLGPDDVDRSYAVRFWCGGVTSASVAVSQGPRAPFPAAVHASLGPGLADEDQTLRLDLASILFPLRSLAWDVRAIAFALARRLFLKLSFSAWTKFHTER
jgi:hypothetical protein